MRVSFVLGAGAGEVGGGPEALCLVLKQEGRAFLDSLRVVAVDFGLLHFFLEADHFGQQIRGVAGIR